MMQDRSGSRTKALLLTAILLTGGLGLPALDALLFHRLPPVQTASTTVGAPGTGAHHGVVCILGAAITPVRAPSAVDSAPRDLALVIGEPRPSPHSPTPQYRPHSPRQPRAPPFPLA